VRNPRNLLILVIQSFNCELFDICVYCMHSSNYGLISFFGTPLIAHHYRTSLQRTTVIESSGTRCAIQMALVPVLSARMWNTKPSLGSMTMSDSPPPSSAPDWP